MVSHTPRRPYRPYPFGYQFSRVKEEIAKPPEGKDTQQTAQNLSHQDQEQPPQNDDTASPPL